MIKPEIIEKLEYIKRNRVNPAINPEFQQKLEEIKRWLNNDGKRKAELIKTMTGSKHNHFAISDRKINKGLRDYSINHRDSDHKINKGLRDYSKNHNSIEDIKWQKSLGGYSKKQAIKEEKTKHKEVKNENNRAELSTEDKESVNKGLKELIKYLRSYTETWNEKYLEQRQHRTPKQLRTVKLIEEESGNRAKCVVDKKFIELFRNLMGISYRGGGILGERIVVDDPKTLEDERLLRHEAIHCAQQREIGGVGKKGFIKWLIISGIDLAKKQFLGETAGLDEAADFATDNQITDYETYTNMFTRWYLKTKEYLSYKKYVYPEFRKKEYERIRNEEYEQLKQKKEQLEKESKWPSNKDKQDIFFEKIEDIESELNQMEHVLKKLKNDNEVRVVLIKPDVPNTKKEDGRFQVWTESEKNRKIRLPIERFIQKHGKVENNYKEGVELRLDFQSTLNELIKGKKLNEDQSKKLEKEFNQKIDKDGLDGLKELKSKYYTDLLRIASQNKYIKVN